MVVVRMARGGHVRARFIECGLVLLMAVIAIWEGSRILIRKWGKLGVPGAGGYILLLGLILAYLAIAHLLQRRSGESRSSYSWGEARDLRRVGVVVLIAIGYVLGIGYLGYLLATALFFVVYLRVFSSYRWLPIVGSSFAGAAGAAYLWAYLGMTLPQGILPWP